MAGTKMSSVPIASSSGRITPVWPGPRHVHCAYHLRAAPNLSRSQRLFLGHCSGNDDAVSPSSLEPEISDFDGLTEDEDWEVPGTVNDSLSSNTRLGRAVQEACDELENLQALERANLTEAEQLLKKLGFKGSLTQASNGTHVEQQPLNVDIPSNGSTYNHQ